MQQLTRFFPVLFIFLSINTSAQFTRGTKMAGASVGSAFFNSGSSDQTVASIGSTSAKITGFGVSITPSLGWFISENTAIGFTFNLNPSGEKITFEENGSTFQMDKSSSFNIGIGGFVRNYFLSSGSFLPFGQFSLDAGIASRKTDGFFYGGIGGNEYKETYDGKSSGGFFTNAIFTIGATKMVGKYTGLDFYAGYNFYYTKNSTKTTRLRDDGINGSIDETKINDLTTKLTNHRFMIGVGFQVFLEGKK